MSILPSLFLIYFGIPITMLIAPIVIGILVYRRHMKKINQNRLPEDADSDYIEASNELNEEYKAGKIPLLKHISAKDETVKLLDGVINGKRRN